MIGFNCFACGRTDMGGRTGISVKVARGLAVAVSLVALLLGLARSAALAGASKDPPPFEPGEKMVLRVRWGIIPAGTAVFEVLPPEKVKGIQTHHFALTVKTTPFIDLFYKLRDRYDGYATADMRRSLLYRKRKHGRKKKDIVVSFDWERKEARYANFGRMREPVPLRPFCLDPLSVFYAFRLLELVEGKMIRIAVTDGKRCVMGSARVLRREKIQVAGRFYDTFLVVPDLKNIRGIFEKSKKSQIKVWVTADERRIPVKVQSAVTVGHFVGELVSYEAGRRVSASLGGP